MEDGTSPPPSASPSSEPDSKDASGKGDTTKTSSTMVPPPPKAANESSSNNNNANTCSNKAPTSSGNSSDNSRESTGLISLGNASFGFNFDSDAATSPATSEAGSGGSGGSGSGAGAGGSNRYDASEAMFDAAVREAASGNGGSTGEKEEVGGSVAVKQEMKDANARGESAQETAANTKESTVSSNTTLNATESMPKDHPPASAVSQETAGKGPLLTAQMSNDLAASTAVSNLSSIASKSVAFLSDPNNNPSLKRKASGISSITVSSNDTQSQSSFSASTSIHPSSEGSASTQFVNINPNPNNNNNNNPNNLQPPPTISSSSSAATSTSNVTGSKKKKKTMDDSKREERNAREKERSYRIASQINELRNLLSSGGVIVPKGTKNAVLTEAANYIRMLQQHQYKSEIHRQQLIQQMQVIGSGALGPQAAQAIRHVAAQNGVWSLGNFGGIPPRTAMTSFPSDQQNQTSQEGQTATFASGDGTGSNANESPLLKTIEENDYRYVFNSCSVPMAIASMGGAFIDCNTLFTQLSDYTKQEICSLTIFNLTSRSDLQHAFDLVSQMISPPAEGQSDVAPQCILRGNMKNKADLGLNITLIKDDDGIAKCFCVTLIQNPAAPFDASRPATMTQQRSDGNKPGNMSSPAFMAG